jgi:hypothetical protein
MLRVDLEPAISAWTDTAAVDLIRECKAKGWMPNEANGQHTLLWMPGRAPMTAVAYPWTPAKMARCTAHHAIVWVEIDVA